MWKCLKGEIMAQGDIVRICGYMETATILNFDVSKTFIEVA